MQTAQISADLVSQYSEHLEPVWYAALGIPFAVASNVEAALQQVHDTYAAFHSRAGSRRPAFMLRLEHIAKGYFVSGVSAPQCWPSYEDALLDLFDRLVHGLLAQLLARDLYAVHAAALVDQGRALMIVGRSGQGKTTLTLGLLLRGAGLLSDELAVADPATQLIHPYRRSLHVRPDTPDLLPELSFLHDRPRYQLGGGSEWAVGPADLEQIAPGCLAQAAPLHAIVLLDGAPRPDEPPLLTPIPAALALLDLMRSTWATTIDFGKTMACMSKLLEQVRCVRLQAGALQPTLDALLEWARAADA